MKEITAILLCALLCLSVWPARAEQTKAQALDASLFSDSRTFSMPLAMAALEMSSMYTKEMAYQYFDLQGFEVLRQENYDKDPADTAHTSAFTVAKKSMEIKGEKRTLLCLTIRGTSGGEWISNFDVAPSHSDDTPVAENFYLAADQIFRALREEMEKTENPLVLVCGHSRGAACANLVGVLLDTVYMPEDVFVYTFATPATTRKDWTGEPYQNIFNLINPGDWVVHMPLAAWGYGRAGVDILLPGDEQWMPQVQSMIRVLEDLSGSISSYYEDRHSLTAPGLAEDGVTVFEWMCMLARSMFMGEQSGELAAWQKTSGMAQNDFTPIMQLLGALKQDPQSSERIGQEHMPDTYMRMMLQMDQNPMG